MACKKVIEFGLRFVLVKYLSILFEGVFSLLFVMSKVCYLVQCFEIEFDKLLVGVGDLIIFVFIVCLVKGMLLVVVFCYINNVVYGVLEVI